MRLLTKVIERKLLANHEKVVASGGEASLKPVVKYFSPVGGATWLITDVDDDGILFGLADLGLGSPELGYVSLKELEEVQLGFGLGIERDLNFEADKTVGEYAAEARELGYIKA